MTQKVRMRGIVKVGMLAALAGILVFALGGTALATTGQNGPTPPKIGDPVGADVSPHGGYSSTTDFCLQCHEVHMAPGQYALLWKSSVTATCSTCHSYFGGATAPRMPNLGPGVMGTASLRSDYDVTAGRNAQHGIGSTSPPGESGITITQSDWAYGWGFTGGPPATNATTRAGPGTASDVGGGLYCASCHTPHGEFGQAVNTKKVVTSTDGTFATQTTVNWAEGTKIWWKNPTTGQWVQKYLHLDVSGWQVCDAGNTNCVPAQEKDSEGQLVSLYGYKLLSAYPNHSYATVKSWGADKYDHDGMKWCGTCHPSRIDVAAGGTYHNHPTGCTACHGNPADASSADFPHTSTFSEFLINYPDALCITCHTTGALP